MPQRWCNSAKLRRSQIESGLDLTFNEVFKPIFINRIAALNPDTILEVGAGTGHLSKELSMYPYKITALEPSPGMFKEAADVLDSSGVTIKKCTSFELEQTNKYDLAFSHLVAQVTDDLQGFFESIASHLKSGSHFLFSIPHPCFYNDYKRFFGAEYNYMRSSTKSVSFHITKDSNNEISDVPYHHRPLSVYIDSLVSAGFSVEGFDEIYPDIDIQLKYGAPWETPRYCMFICEKL